MENIQAVPTPKQTRQAVKDANEALMSVRITFTEYDEYRVNFIAGREATAYYTSDVDDAIGSAKLMDAEGLKGGR